MRESENWLLALPTDFYQLDAYNYKYMHKCMIMQSTICFLIGCRSTPVECLHTILLGPYKYLTRELMDTISPDTKQKIVARIKAFNSSGLGGKLSSNIVYHHRSFHGKDYKLWAQMAPFIIWPFITESQRRVWLSLSKVAHTQF